MRVCAGAADAFHLHPSSALCISFENQLQMQHVCMCITSTELVQTDAMQQLNLVQTDAMQQLKLVHADAKFASAPA